MENKTVAIAILSVLMLGLAIYGLTSKGILPSPFSIYAYAKEVPVQVGYDPAKNYWVLSSVINERESFKMVLHSESADNVDSDTQAKAKSEVTIAFDPLPPYSKTNLVVTDYKYAVRIGVGDVYEKAPVYDVNDAGWLTTARYKIEVVKNGMVKVSKTVSVNYKEPKTIYLQTDEGTVTVNNLGMLPQGVEVPSGDLIVVQDPYGKWHIFDKADFLRAIDKWNEWFTIGEGHITRIGWTATWKNFWEWISENGYLPKDVELTHVSNVEFSSDMRYITLTYSDVAFAGVITVYIPEDLADTIIINLFAPKPQIISIIPEEIPPIEEGQKTTLTVKVKNVGTEGSVSVTASSAYYGITPLTSTFRSMREDEVAEFKFEVHALNVEKDTEATIEILAQGRGGIDTKIVKGTILNREGYTPPSPTKNTWLKIILVDAESFEPVSDAKVIVDTGQKYLVKTSDRTGTVEFDLGTFEGNVKVTVEPPMKYSKVEKIIGVSPGANVVAISLASNWLAWLLEYWYVFVMLIIGLFIIIVIKYKGGM